MEESEKNLVLASAVLCLSPTTEVARNRVVDSIVMQTATIMGLEEGLSSSGIYETLRKELPLRYEEIVSSIGRNVERGSLEVVSGGESGMESAVVKLSGGFHSELSSESERISDFLEEATKELFEDVYEIIGPEKIGNCLLDCVSRIMARYGYAYAGQVAGIMEASEFVPKKALKEVCEKVIKEHKISEISVERMMEGIGVLFDRRDPCLNNLAFCICQRYYSTRLLGMDIPLDFFSGQVYKDATMYMDTNFILSVVFSKPGRHDEFKEVLKFAPSLGIKFAVSELSIAESLVKTNEYRELLDQGEETVPARLLMEAEEDILEGEVGGDRHDEGINLIDSKQAQRLREMGIEILKIEDTGIMEAGEELEEIKKELGEFDRKYRRGYKRKDNEALYHDAELFYIVKMDREKSGKVTSGWFLTEDNSVIAFGISKKGETGAPYSIKLPTLLHTLSPFVESQVLRIEFEELFMSLISKDLLPTDQVFTSEDLKMFIGLDIKAQDIPPEFVRKGITHVKKEILKGGGITEDNRAQIIYEFNKFISAPDTNLIELQRRHRKRIEARDAEIESKEVKVRDLEGRVKRRDLAIVAVVGVCVSGFLWIAYAGMLESMMEVVKRPLFIAVALQVIIISVAVRIMCQRVVAVQYVCVALVTIGSLLTAFV